jgi:hypothetical protein
LLLLLSRRQPYRYHSRDIERTCALIRRLNELRIAFADVPREKLGKSIRLAMSKTLFLASAGARRSDKSPVRLSEQPKCEKVWNCFLLVISAYHVVACAR